LDAYTASTNVVEMSQPVIFAEVVDKDFGVHEELLKSSSVTNWNERIWPRVSENGILLDAAPWWKAKPIMSDLKKMEW